MQRSNPIPLKVEHHTAVKSKRSGFTLPEVLITSFLIMLMMLPLSRLAFSTISRTRYAYDVGQVVALGQQKMEEFTDTAYEDLVSGNENAGGYRIRWKVTPLSEHDAKLVEMKITWQTLGRELSLDFNGVFIL